MDWEKQASASTQDRLEGIHDLDFADLRRLRLIPGGGRDFPLASTSILALLHCVNQINLYSSGL